jgi:hypothetical protein
VYRESTQLTKSQPLDKRVRHEQWPDHKLQGKVMGISTSPNTTGPCQHCWAQHAVDYTTRCGSELFFSVPALVPASGVAPVQVRETHQTHQCVSADQPLTGQDWSLMRHVQGGLHSKTTAEAEAERMPCKHSVGSQHSDKEQDMPVPIGPARAAHMLAERQQP